MTETTYTIDRRSDSHGSVVHLRLSGPFHSGARRDLQRAVLGALAGARVRELVVDVRAMTLIDPENVQTLLAGYVAAMRHGHGYRIVNPRRRLRRVLGAAGLLPAP